MSLELIIKDSAFLQRALVLLKMEHHFDLVKRHLGVSFNRVLLWLRLKSSFHVGCMRPLSLGEVEVLNAPVVPLQTLIIGQGFSLGTCLYFSLLCDFQAVMIEIPRVLWVTGESFGPKFLDFYYFNLSREACLELAFMAKLCNGDPNGHEEVHHQRCVDDVDEVLTEQVVLLGVSDNASEAVQAVDREQHDELVAHLQPV